MNSLLGLEAQFQIELLTLRGWEFSDKQKATNLLKHVSLVHLSLLNNNLKYLCRANFDNVMRLHQLDRSLRRALFQSIEVFEISLRRNLGMFFASKYGALNYDDENNFEDTKEHKKWFNGVRNKLINKGLMTDELIVFPVAIEVLTFTGLKVFYESLLKDDQASISKNYDVSANKFLSWLAMLREVRNSCAHHDAIWNQRYSSKSEEHQSEKDFRWLPPLVLDGNKQEKSIFYVILVLSFLLKNIDEKNQQLRTFKSLLEQFSELNLVSRSINIPSKWKSHPLLAIEI
ncbi:Abi family protein [Thalassomonas haliotis]|uniref:Abi family protein n=1 Tax=Thalassomonas haliotis TaxID=485448 RepID=A0ABY7VHB3_9GAMM|nr:Abi family protein [Thalassomonas haliotis]WDE12323.1 Abi family protein [Thalassomonas haliotis]